MQVSKLTSKYQATIPSDIRKFLGVGQGDRVAFSIKQDKVFLRKASPLDIQFLKATESTLSEWNSDEDDKLFGDL